MQSGPKSRPRGKHWKKIQIDVIPREHTVNRMSSCSQKVASHLHKANLVSAIQIEGETNSETDTKTSSLENRSTALERLTLLGEWGGGLKRLNVIPASPSAYTMV